MQQLSGKRVHAQDGRNAQSLAPVAAPVRATRVAAARSRTSQRVLATAQPVNPFAASASTAAPVAPQASSTSSSGSEQHPWTEHTWKWRGYTIGYKTAGCGEPILLVHGFGLSSFHYRRNIPVLAEKYKVYAIDLLGFGASSKPIIQFSMELWRDLLVDFVGEFMGGRPVTLVGNSIGALACLMTNAALPAEAVRGTVLLNSAGAMNNKGVVADWRIVAVYPLLLFIDFLLSIPAVSASLFNNVRTKANIMQVLQNGVYTNPDAVDQELVDQIYAPSCDAGAREVFVSVITGPPGPQPWKLMSDVSGPLLVLWGDKDTLTPADGPVGKYLANLPSMRPETTFTMLQDVGHCLHDDKPELVHAQLLPWLERAMAGQPTCSDSTGVRGAAAAALPASAAAEVAVAAAAVAAVAGAGSGEGFVGEDDVKEAVKEEKKEEADVPAAVAGQRATCEWCLSNGAEWADTCAFAAARAGHPALAEWLISQRPPGAPGSVSRSIFLTSVARGCDLPTLQRLCSSWLSSTTNSPGAAPGNPAPGATGSSPSTRAGCLYSAAQSRTSDWEAKLEWLDGRGLCPALGPPCPRSLEVCRAAAGVRLDAEAQRRLAWLQRAGFPLSWRALAAAAGAGNVGTLRWLLQDQHVDPDTILTSWEAFSEGQLEAVQVLHAADCRIEPARSMRVAVGATAPGPFPDIARWLVETFGVDAVGLGPELSEEAARAGSVEVLDALAGWGCAFGPRAWVAAAVSGCEAALDWLSTQGCPMPDDGRPFLEAAWHGDLACLARLQRLGCPLGPNPHGLFTRAVFSRQGARRFANAASLDALRWLAGEGGCAVAWQAARDAAGNRAEGDREAVLEWLDRAQEEAEAGAREQVGAGQEAQAEG